MHRRCQRCRQSGCSSAPTDHDPTIWMAVIIPKAVPIFKQMAAYAARLAQSVERETLNLKVVGSTPTSGSIPDVSKRPLFLRFCTSSLFEVHALFAGSFPFHLLILFVIRRSQSKSKCQHTSARVWRINPFLRRVIGEKVRAECLANLTTRTLLRDVRKSIRKPTTDYTEKHEE